MERLVERVNKLLSEKKIKTFKMFTSMDTWGKPAEYIRTGLNLEVWEQNFHIYMSKTNLPLTFMITFNAMVI